MANYSLVVNSTFQPFSFERYIQPYQIYGQAYKEQESAIEELATKANVWEGIANKQSDPYAYNMYKKYSDDLKSQADILASQGLTPSSRRALAQMKGRYSSEITPIEIAYKRRQELLDEQRKLKAQDNTLMIDRDASTISLDELIRNPQLSYQSYSGATLAKQVGDAAKNLSKEVKENPRKWRSILGNQYFESIMQRGYKPEDILQVIQNDPKASPILQEIVNDVIGSSGIINWRDKNILDRAYDYARQGLWSAVGDTQYQIQSNKGYDYYMKDKADREKQQEALLNSLAINPLNVYSTRELNEQEKAYNKAIKDYSDYFTTNERGEIIITPEGLEEYKRDAGEKSREGIRVQDMSGVPSSVSDYSDTEFKKFLDSIGVDPLTKWADNINTRHIGNLWKKYVEESPVAKTSKYDATKVTEFDYSIAGTQQGDMKDAIMTANRGLDLKEVDYDSKSKKFKETGEKITMEDLKGDKYKVTATRFSPYGNTVMIQDDKGNVRRFRMPSGINPYNEEFRDIAMSDVLHYQEKLNNPNLSEEVRLRYENAYRKAVQQAYLYHSQLGVQNKTEEQKFNPYGY